MGAPSKRARRVRSSSEFSIARLRSQVRTVTAAPRAYAWTLVDIVAARDDQLRGSFKRPAGLAESFRTDDALFTARENRLAPQRAIKVELRPCKGAKPSTLAEADALFGQDGIAVDAETRRDIHSCLVDHGVAFAVNEITVREDGSRVDFAVKYWPIEWVRWDSVKRAFVTQIEGAAEEVITHGDGRWIVFRIGEHEPFKNGTLLAAALVWARHAFALRDWAKGSVAHGAAKVVGEMPSGVALQKADGTLSDEAAAFLELLRAIGSGDAPVGIRPAGSKTEFLTNTSTAWQVWNELTLNAEKAAARIYLGTDGTLGSQGGAPGVDVQALFGVASTKVQGDLGAISRGLQTGAIDVWHAINFGTSIGAPRHSYLIPDDDADAARLSTERRRAAFFADMKAAREEGFAIDQKYVDDVARKFGIEPPSLPPPAAVAPPQEPQAAPSALRLVSPPQPSAFERAEHAARMSGALLADVREARALGLTFSQAQIDETAKRYGVPAPRMEAK